MKRSWMMGVLAATGISSSAFATGTPPAPCTSPTKPDFSVVPFVMNNGRNVVVSEWKNALGCPKDPTGSGSDPVYGCPFPDGTVVDSGNQGLLMSKTVASADPSFAGADFKGVRGVQLCEIGYDLRKPFSPYGPAGSHCGARSPRIEITTKDRQGQNSTSYMYIDPTGDGCTVPPPVTEPANYWQRLRWVPTTCPGVSGACIPACATTNVQDCLTNQPGAVTNLYGQRVERMRIVFDEGPDATAPLGFPDQFALSVLDNIDVNGKLVGSGPSKVSYDDEDRGEGHDDGGHDWRFRGSSSHPEGTEFQYSDSSSGKNVQGVNGARSTTYSNGPLGEKCVNIAGDALVNGSAGYLYNFVACDLWLFGGLGSYALTVTGGPLGSVPYQQTGTISSGYVSIHE